jgi:ParB/RepB/Spo0J family partition protein
VEAGGIIVYVAGAIGSTGVLELEEADGEDGINLEERMINAVKLETIRANPWQTRTHELDAEGVKELAMDILEHGLLQAPWGRLAKDGKTVELAFGHRRLAAYQWLNDVKNNSNMAENWGTMPVWIQALSDQEMAELAWAENEKRRDVSAMERALAIQKRITDFKWSQQEAAEHLGIARSTVANILRLLKLPENMQAALAEGKISERQAQALLPMYELPAHVLEAGNMLQWQRGPRRLEQDALNEVSSDELRRGVEVLYNQLTIPLGKAEFGLDELFQEGEEIYCGLCRTCDRRMAERGNLCTDRMCYKKKTQIWQLRYLLKASGASGIEVIDPDKGGLPTTLGYGDRTERILETRCKNLRLMYVEGKGEGIDRVKGYPHALIVCDKRNQSCTCMKGLAIAAAHPATPAEIRLEDAEREDDDAEIFAELDEEQKPQMSVGAQTARVDAAALEDLARQARKEKKDVAGEYKKLHERLVELAAEWLANDEPGAFYVLVKRSIYPGLRSPDLIELYDEAARQIVAMLMGQPEIYDNAEDLYQKINFRLGNLGLSRIEKARTLVEVWKDE